MKHPLTAFFDALNAGGIRIVDLTHTLSPEFPTLVLPPQFGQVWPFKLETISKYDQAGPGWFWNNFSCGEHTGTHFDAPAHWITGKEHPDNTVDTIECRNFVAPASVVDASREVAANPDWLLTVEFINPLFPALRTGPTAAPGAARQKQIPRARLLTPSTSSLRCR